MNDIIPVEARFETDGSIRPLAFYWKGDRHQIASTGRQWETEGERHFLVMTFQQKVYELSYSHEEGFWQLRRKPSDFDPPQRIV
jgi:hypothetical protein